jgi:uncharacterized repeat protein (TIGR01451 family)
LLSQAGGNGFRISGEAKLGRFQEEVSMRRNSAGFVLALPLLLLPLGENVRRSAAQDTADLALTKEVDKKHAKIGENMTFTITLTNLGPSTATDVTFGDPVPDPLNLVSIACSQGVAVGSSCEVGSVASGVSVTATLVLTPITNPARSERKFTNTAFISESATTDPNSGNNSATLDLHIVGKTP